MVTWGVWLDLSLIFFNARLNRIRSGPASSEMSAPGLLFEAECVFLCFLGGFFPMRPTLLHLLFTPCSLRPAPFGWHSARIPPPPHFAPQNLLEVGAAFPKINYLM